MTTQTPTIIDLKTSFLQTQISLLSQPLSPSPRFLTANASDEENALQQKSIDEALNKLKKRLTQHNNLVYAPQMRRHVVEQVDRLYWKAVESGESAGGLGEEDRWVERGVDYRQPDIIDQLPSEWDEEAEARVPVEAARFKELQSRLVELNQKRAAARERLENTVRLRGLLDLFGGEAGLQDNLVVRNGDVEEELERMRRLMLRFERAREGADHGDREGRGGEDDGDVEMEGVEESKIMSLLGSP